MRIYKILLVMMFTLPVLNVQAKGEHKHDYSPSIMAFHTVLSPVWHMDAGAERNKLACDSAESFVEKAKAVVDANTNTAKQQQALNLLTSSKGLFGGCIGAADQIEKDLLSIHDAFHALIEE
ncbi:MAG: hypothetical protein ACWA5R_05370 [bacterium]